MADRLISELPSVYRKMAVWAHEDDWRIVRDSTKAVHRIASAHGGSFALHGRGGKRVPLTATSNVKRFGTSAVGFVKGIPEGFWHIVEYGRGGGYLVASRQTRTGGRRRGSQASLIRRHGTEDRDGSGFGDLKPIRTPMGPRMYAKPGPHGPIGKPWKTAMARGGVSVQAIHSHARTTVLARAFTN
jgi:hypothetical protein